MTDLTQELKEYLTARGADLVGCADLSEIVVEMSDEVSDELSKDGMGDESSENDVVVKKENSTERLKYGIAVAVSVPADVVACILDGPTEEYFEAYHEMEEKLRGIALAGEEFLRARGFNAFAQTSDRVREDEQWRTEIPHKTAATNAGLGWIGKSCLLVTEKFGSAIRLSSILTDAPLVCDTPIRESRCGSCRKCVDACPAHALSGSMWTIGVDRDEILDKELCVSKQIELTRARTGIESEFLCGRCFAVCPYTRRYLRKQGTTEQGYHLLTDSEVSDS